MTKLNDLVKSAVINNTPVLQRLSYPAVARTLMFRAYALAKSKRSKKKSDAYKPAWEHLAREILELSTAVSSEMSAVFCDSVGDKKLSQFATMSATEKGTLDKFFYSTVLLYITLLDDDCFLRDDYFSRLQCPSDNDLRSTIEEVFLAILEDRTVDERHQHRTSVRFMIEDYNLTRVQKFVDHFRSPDDGCAHLVLYRSSKSNPLRLMKSFLAISPPERANTGTPANIAQTSSFGYTHIYRPPQAENKPRFSSGKIVPLENGLYFVGGQNPLVDPSNPRSPFKGLKVIVFRWPEIDRLDSRLHGAVLSTNYRGEVIATSLVARITPAYHSNQLNLGAIGLAELSSDLKEDERQEMEILRGSYPNVHSDPDALPARFGLPRSDEIHADTAADIVQRTDNALGDALGWEVLDGVIRKASTEKKTVPVTKAAFEALMERALRDSNFSDSDGSVPTVWSMLRVGPLSL